MLLLQETSTVHGHVANFGETAGKNVFSLNMRFFILPSQPEELISLVSTAKKIILKGWKVTDKNSH